MAGELGVFPNLLHNVGRVFSIFGFLGPVSLSGPCLLAVNILSSLTFKVGMPEFGILYGADRQFFL